MIKAGITHDEISLVAATLADTFTGLSKQSEVQEKLVNSPVMALNKIASFIGEPLKWDLDLHCHPLKLSPKTVSDSASAYTGYSCRAVL